MVSGSEKEAIKEKPATVNNMGYGADDLSDISDISDLDDPIIYISDEGEPNEPSKPKSSDTRNASDKPHKKEEGGKQLDSKDEDCVYVKSEPPRDIKTTTKATSSKSSDLKKASEKPHGPNESGKQLDSKKEDCMYVKSVPPKDDKSITKAAPSKSSDPKKTSEKPHGQNEGGKQLNSKEEDSVCIKSDPPKTNKRLTVATPSKSSQINVKSEPPKDDKNIAVPSKSSDPKKALEKPHRQNEGGKQLDVCTKSKPEKDAKRIAEAAPSKTSDHKKASEKPHRKEEASKQLDSKDDDCVYIKSDTPSEPKIIYILDEDELNVPSASKQSESSDPTNASDKSHNQEEGGDQLQENGVCGVSEPLSDDKGATVTAPSKSAEIDEQGKKDIKEELEEGEVLDDGEVVEEPDVIEEDEAKPKSTEPKPICRYFAKGECKWADYCRFVHPGRTGMWYLTGDSPGGQPDLVIDYYRFLFETRVNGLVFWKCSLYGETLEGCNCQAVTMACRVIEFTGTHNHYPQVTPSEARKTSTDELDSIM